MKNRTSALAAFLILCPVFPLSAQVAAEDPAEAARIAQPLREELVAKMDGWRPILFLEPASDADPVRAKYGARFDALETAVRAQRHPGDIARSRYAFNQLLEDALHDRFRAEKKDSKTSAGFKEYRERASREAERTAAAALTTRDVVRRETAFAELPPSALFDGAVIGGAVEPPAAPAPLPVLASRPIASMAVYPVAVVPERTFVEATRATGAARYDKVRAILTAQGVDPKIVDTGIRQALAQNFDPILLLAVSQQESRFNPRAVSRVGARGLMQLMPETAADYGVKNADDLFDPATNFRVGIEHFKRLCALFAGAGMCGDGSFDPTKRGSVLTAASWNAGEGSVIKHAGVPPFQETREFVRKVLAYYAKFAAAN